MDDSTSCGYDRERSAVAHCAASIGPDRSLPLDHVCGADFNGNEACKAFQMARVSCVPVGIRVSSDISPLLILYVGFAYAVSCPQCPLRPPRYSVSVHTDTERFLLNKYARDDGTEKERLRRWRTLRLIYFTKYST